jgi:hypothetical protein
MRVFSLSLSQGSAKLSLLTEAGKVVHMGVPQHSAKRSLHVVAGQGGCMSVLPEALLCVTPA